MTSSVDVWQSMQGNIGEYVIIYYLSTGTVSERISRWLSLLNDTSHPYS